MTPMRYPFRFYGREPADWTPSPHGFLYEVQFAEPRDGDARAAVRALAERHFGRGPAELADVWQWGGERFLVLALRERFGDSPRMVFTHVAEFLARVHQDHPLRDVVFSNGFGARADRWDAWSLAQSREPDAGPARPDAPWAALLRRPEDGALRWDASEPSPRADAVSTRPAPTPAARRPRAARLALAPCEPPAGEAPASRGWALIESAFAGEALERVESAPVPIGWHKVDGRNAAIVFLDGSGAPRRLALPPGPGDAVHLAVDPDGLHAVTHVGQDAYSVDLGQGTMRLRYTSPMNNGPFHAIAWAEGDLWLLRTVPPFASAYSQLQLWDLSEQDAIYVGTQLVTGEMLGAFRHGTVAAVRAGARVTLVGVCDWQLKALGTIAVGRDPVRIVDDALYVGAGARTRRLENLDAVYEAWAAPLRRRAEADRKRRVRPPKQGVRWQAVARDAMPPDAAEERVRALKATYGETAAITVNDAGDAVVATALALQHLSRGAAVRAVPAAGKARRLRSATAAEQQGVADVSLDPRGETAYFVTGQIFHVHRIDVARDKTSACNIAGFATRQGLLYTTLALGRDDVVAVWNDSVDWHRAARRAWRTHSRVKLDLPRSAAHDPASRRIVVTQQTRARLLVLHPGERGFEQLAACTDAIKRVSFREGRLFAQMLDGQWFELLGADAPPAASARPARAKRAPTTAKRAKPATKRAKPATKRATKRAKRGAKSAESAKRAKPATKRPKPAAKRAKRRG